MTHRILQIIATLDRAGAEKQLVTLAQGLRRRDYDVHVCALTRGGPLEKDLASCGIPTHIIGKQAKFDPWAYWKLRTLIKDVQPTVVHTWMFTANAYGRAAALGAGVPHIVASERCVDPWKSSWQFAIDRHLAKQTDRIVVNSSGVQRFCTQHGIAREKISIIHGAASLMDVEHHNRQAFLQSLGLDNSVILIGTVGRLWPQKRVKDLIWAIDQLSFFRKNVHLVIAGDGPQRNRLEQYARELEVAHLIHFLGHRDDIPQILPLFDILWLGSEYEGLPNSIMEGMLAGLPVVATDIPGNRDLVVHGETGYLTSVGSPPKRVRFTERLLADPSMARNMGLQGRKRAEEHFSVQEMVDKHVALYDSLLR